MIGEDYTLEYGTDRIEMHVGAVEAGERVIVIDDLIATGGTLGASVNLISQFLDLSLSLTAVCWTLRTFSHPDMVCIVLKQPELARKLWSVLVSLS